MVINTQAINAGNGGIMNPAQGTGSGVGSSNTGSVLKPKKARKSGKK